MLQYEKGKFAAENGFGGIWTYEKRADEEESAVRSVRTPLGTMRFGKRGPAPLGTMRFGKRTELEHFLDALALARQEDDGIGSGNGIGGSGGGSSGIVASMYGRESYLGPYGKRNSPLGTMRFGK